MPEYPEMEALRRALDEPVRRAPVERAGPAHIATLKTFEPPLAALEGAALDGVRRRAKRLLFPSLDGRLVLAVHLMTNGKLRYHEPGAKTPKSPMFRLRFADGGELALTETGSRKAAGVWLLTPEQAEAALAHLGPEAHGLGAGRLAAICAAESRRVHALLRDQRAIAGVGRAWANEILHTAQLSPFALTRDLSGEEIARLAAAIDEELARGLALREQGRSDLQTYRVHDHVGDPCHICGTPLCRVDYETMTIVYCPACQTGGRLLKDRRMSRLLR
jgi:formamidopyrimidine-DNA glycosylase